MAAPRTPAAPAPPPKRSRARKPDAAEPFDQAAAAAIAPDTAPIAARQLAEHALRSTLPPPRRRVVVFSILDINVAAVATRLGVSRQLASDTMKERRNARLETALAEAAGFTPAQFFPERAVGASPAP